MSNPNQNLPPPFIAEPPIYDQFFKEDGVTISNPWVNWLNSVTRVMGYCIVQDYIKNPISGEIINEVPLLQATSMTQTDRNNLDNARDGTIIYNLTTGRMNFREGGAWVTFTPIPA